MTVSILVPYAPAGPVRERSWRWLEQRWRATLPDAEVILGTPDDAPDPGRFCRAVAINRAAAKASGDVFVIADADTAFLAEGVYEAVFLASRRWILPYRYVRLSEAASDAWLTSEPTASPPADWESGVEEEWPANVSGLVVVSRAAFELVGGFDERFTGWGCEDEAFACSLAGLYAAPLRLAGHVAWHLWHPRPPEHSVGQPTYQAQRQLAARYARASPSGLRKILSER